MTPEGRVKALVKRVLPVELSGVYMFMPVQNGMGAPGLDWFNCWRGLFFAIETKPPGGTYTPRQEITRAKILAAGGMVFLVTDRETLNAAIAAIKRKSHEHRHC